MSRRSKEQRTYARIMRAETADRRRQLERIRIEQTAARMKVSGSVFTAPAGTLPPADKKALLMWGQIVGKYLQ
jgi:hypothetical protein